MNRLRPIAPIRVDLVDDAGPPYPKESVKIMSVIRERFDIPGNFPSGCTGCGESFAAALPYYLQTYPDSRFALLSYTADATIAGAFGITQPEFTTALGKLAAERFDGHPNAKYFFIDGTAHETLGNLALAGGGTTLGKWLAAMESDDPTWESVKP